MFKFEFDLDDADIDNDIDSYLQQADELLGVRASSRNDSGKISQENSESIVSREDGRFVELTMEQLLDALPTQLSYSPLEIPLSSSSTATPSTFSEPNLASGSRVHYLARRDLFDARFQVISEDNGNPNVVAEAETTDEKTERIGASVDPRLQFLDTPSDLVPGVYEGGMKTWECSLDLVDYLHASLKDGDLEGKRVLELGCGTGIPSLYLLQKIFSSPSTESALERSAIHFQDYNPSALELVTFPNVLLTWYMSPASDTFLSSQASSLNAGTDEILEYPAKDPTNAGELIVTPALKDAFKQSLEKYNVELRFFGGSWKSFENAIGTGTHSRDAQTQDVSQGSLGGYDILLTSETIYRTESVPELIHAMWQSTHPSTSSSCPSSQLSQLTISEPRPPRILVAAKVFYFGVGGGVDEFAEAVRRWNGASGVNTEITTVWEKNVGVGRRIIQVVWSSHGELSISGPSAL
ncbi:hypothetical protein C8J55DRAFT_563921 [Lentinula edodes]|uniref:protein-histidine N-methyltransferase n=1 Tax=Lentinula lateritia TaxID=40482 RepID=A0A9W9DIA3_9AGAR|nr:hypothetical protein C8J55DRAFT_563921 [Lentinula edodes]